MYVAHERRAYILRLLEQQGHLRSAELARDLGVTDETIRTDLVALQKQGLLARVHGGARYILPQGNGGGTAQGADHRMADMLAQEIRPGMCLFLDSTPFSLLLAWRLRDTPCRIATASPTLLHRIGTRTPGHRLFSAGGEFDTAAGLFSAQGAGAFLTALAPDIAVLRSAALTPALPGSQADGTVSLGYNSPTQAAWAETAARHAARCFLAVPAAHLGGQAPHTLTCRPELILTEDNLPPDMEGWPTVRTVPYISRESLLPADGFDY